MSDDQEYVSKVDRRTALAWVGVVGAALAGGAGVVVYGPKMGGKAPVKGYGTDPKLNPPVKAAWPRVMTPLQLQVAAVLSDFILPASGDAPAATALGVPDFVDEWVSAPYPDQLKDKAIILDGLEALNLRARTRQGADFMKLSAGHRLALMQALQTAEGPDRAFFRKFRSLVVGAYYTTEVGFKDIGYIGNVARAKDPGPSDEVKAHLERELTKLGL